VTRRGTAAALGCVLFLTGVAGCAPKADRTTAANPCRNVERPGWIDDAYVGVARMTASGNRNDQKRIALERAIADLLMTKGVARGESVMSVQKDLSVHNDRERFRKHFNVNTEMNIVYRQMKYDIRITDIWRDPCTDELYVRIEEK